jgi:hypothetical protein
MDCWSAPDGRRSARNSRQPHHACIGCTVDPLAANGAMRALKEGARRTPVAGLGCGRRWQVDVGWITVAQPCDKVLDTLGSDY